MKVIIATSQSDSDQDPKRHGNSIKRMISQPVKSRLPGLNAEKDPIPEELLIPKENVEVVFNDDIFSGSELDSMIDPNVDNFLILANEELKQPKTDEMLEIFKMIIHLDSAECNFNVFEKGKGLRKIEGSNQPIGLRLIELMKGDI